MTVRGGDFPFHRSWDGHTHTEFCPHGSHEQTEDFVRAAIEAGFERYSITEHMPFAPEFIGDSNLIASCTMAEKDTEAYFETCYALKQKYRNDIDLRIGFEIDWIPEYIDWTRAFLSKWGSHVEDSILSVHFLQEQIVDSTPDRLREHVLPLYGSVEAMHRAYYRELATAAKADLGFQVNRIGHMHLIRKFIKKVPLEDPNADFNQEYRALLDVLDAMGIGLDVNVAGLLKPHCGEVYVSDDIIQMIVDKNRNIPLVYGSDTHSVKGVGQKHAEYLAIADRFPHRQPMHSSESTASCTP